MKRALLVIDVQESFRQQESWGTTNNPDIVDDVSRLVEHARANSQLVIWVLHQDIRGGGPFDPVNGLVTLMPGLQPRPEDNIYVKSSINAFTTTGLAQQLTRLGIRQLRLAGIRAEQCVETTARVASDLGYEVEVVIDATASHPLPYVDSDQMMTAAEVSRHTAARLHNRFATITTVADVVAS